MMSQFGNLLLSFWIRPDIMSGGERWRWSAPDR